MSMYTGAKTVVRIVYRNSKGFEVKVGMHQGSAHYTITHYYVSLIMRGSSMLHGSETWPVRKENLVALQRVEMRMVMMILLVWQPIGCTKYSVNCKNTKMSNYRVNYILDIMVQTIRYKRMLKFNSSAF